MTGLEFGNSTVPMNTQCSETVKIPMAGIEFGRSPDVLETLLGSCVGIAVWDPQSGHGGLAHVMLASSEGEQRQPGKFADTAVAELTKQLLKQGCHPLRLQAKIAGGARMFGRPTGNDIGTRNCEAVLQHLQDRRIKVLAQHVGGSKGRVIHFSLSDGSMTVMIGRNVVAVI